MDYARKPGALGGSAGRGDAPRGGGDGSDPSRRRNSGGGGSAPPSNWLRRLRLPLLALIGIILIGIGGYFWWREGRWRYIVVHHTASNYGDLEYYREMHVQERGWSDIAYHFVINNGTANTALGQIQESDLWKERRAGFSTRVWFINYFGIAVVMVGNFEEREPPALQMESLVTLLTRLSREYDIPPERIRGHREVQNTKCPGKHLNMHEVRERVQENLRESR